MHNGELPYFHFSLILSKFRLSFLIVHTWFTILNKETGGWVKGYKIHKLKNNFNFDNRKTEPFKTLENYT